MSDFYRENILDHYKNPRNHGSLKDADASIKESNPLCGDCLTLELKCDEGGVITDVAFVANGCALSVASASLLSEKVKGKSIKDLKKMNHENMQDLLEIKIGTGRIKCLMLPLVALHKAIDKIQMKKHD